MERKKKPRKYYVFCQQILTKHLSEGKLKTLGTGKTFVLSTAVVYECLRDHVNHVTTTRNY